MVSFSTNNCRDKDMTDSPNMSILNSSMFDVRYRSSRIPEKHI